MYKSLQMLTTSNAAVSYNYTKSSGKLGEQYMVLRLALTHTLLAVLITSLLACGEPDGGITVASSAQQPSPSGESSDGDRSQEGLCETDTNFMENRAWPKVLSQCVTCHQARGLAGQSAFILEDSLSALNTNYAAIESYNNGYPSWLLDKPMARGVSHGGGIIFSDGDEHFAIISELLARFDTPITSCETDTTEPNNASSLDTASLLSKLTLASPAQSFRKAALLLAGRLPDKAELALITEDNLKSNIRNLMSGLAFESFLMEAANDQLLTLKWAGSRTPGLSALNGEHFYPKVNSRIGPLEEYVEQLQEQGGSEEAIQTAQNTLWDTINQTNLALAQEPLRLINHVVQMERPYGEVLTADYILVNPYINDVFDTKLTFTNPLNGEDWQPAQINSGYRNGANLPHAGILSSPMFLARYPSTDTNRNRARARWSYYFFLGLDIEGLAVRPMNSDSLQDVDNPTLNNPDCAVCHEIMDPVAGAFQNWGNDGQFRDQCGWFPDSADPDGGQWLCDLDALPWVGYKEFFDPYVAGDLWYRDMRKPGFNSVLLATNEKDNSLSWLAQQMIQDPRFASGTVKFWFKGVFAREPTPLPTNTSDAQFSGLMAAYEVDNFYISEFSNAFADGSAGTASHERFNLKDLLVDMLVSPLFRAHKTSQALNEDERVALRHVGLGRLLSPEQLNRKLNALLGSHWGHVWNEDQNQLLQDFYGFYGGIDSDGVTDRNTRLNTLMATVVERYSSEMVCRLVIDEFEQSSSQRLLFTNLNLNDTPQTSNGRAAIRLVLQSLINRLWGSDYATEIEIDAAYELLVSLRDERLQNNATTVLATNNDQAVNDDNDEFCQLDWQSQNALVEDSNQMARPWMGVLMYLISDYRMLYL